MNYLLDTNVLLEGLLDYITTKNNCGIIIPSVVLEELNHIKENKDGEISFKARRAIRDLIEIKRYGNLNDWVKLDNEVSIHIHHHFDTGLHLRYSVNDDIIIGTLSDVQKEFGKTIMVSSDFNLILKCEGFGFSTEIFKYKYDVNRFYSGHIEVYVNNDIIDEFYKNGQLCWEKVLTEKPYENQFVTLISYESGKKQALSIFKNEYLTRLKYGDKNVFGDIKGKNRQQKYLLEILMDDSIPIVAVNSEAGTGKSFLTVIAGLQKVLEDGIYDRILYVKPLEPMGQRDVGYLSGDKNLKLLNGYSGTIINILENIFAKREKQYNKFSYAEDLIEKGYLHVEAMTFMRGMSYYKTFMIIDESSNINKSDIKNIITRCGEGSKCCIIGDSAQLDNSKLNQYENGLQYAIEQLKGSQLFGTVRLDKSVRSEVAQLCVDKL